MLSFICALFFFYDGDIPIRCVFVLIIMYHMFNNHRSIPRTELSAYSIVLCEVKTLTHPSYAMFFGVFVLLFNFI